MRAAQFHAARDIRIEDIPRPEASSDKILVEVEWCGICGSDLNEYTRGPFAIPPPGRPHPLTKATLPIPLGHEFSGRIVHIPESLSSSTSLYKGQPVFIDARFYCKACAACNSSATNICETLGFMGLSGGGGGLSECVAVEPDHILPLPETLPDGTKIDLAAAALIEPLCVAWHGLALYRGIANLNDKEGSLGDMPILVVGAGPVGIAMIYVLRAQGTKRVFVSEVSKARRETAADIGKDVIAGVFDPTEDDIAAKCKELSGGGGVAAVFDCAGAQAGFDAGCQSLRFRGVYVNLALPKTPITIPIGSFLFKELMYRCSLAYEAKDVKETVDAFVQGRFQGVERMITRRIHLEDVVEKGFEELIKPNEHIKILTTPKRDNLPR
ncbi:chaperonin 10-like protein [Aspergillus unguis]